MNGDLISRSALLAELNDTKYAWQDYDAVEGALRNIPAVDAVPVVRCKDCLWFKSEHGCPLHESGYSKDGKMLPLEDDFCSYGERRADHATD